MRTQRPVTRGADQDIRNIVEASDRLESIKQCTDFPAHLARRRTVRTYRASDQPQRDVRHVEVGKGSNLADAVNLRGPLIDIVDVDQSDVEVHINVVACPARIKLFEQPAAELR